MPHIIIETTPSITQIISPADLVKRVHASAISIDWFPTVGVRTRLYLADHFEIADGDPRNIMVHVNIRIGNGFTEEAKRSAVARIDGELTSCFAEHIKTIPISLSVEISELDSKTRTNHSNLRDLAAVASQHAV